LVAPLEGTVIPLPHQLLALQRAISGDRIRYLLADEVGLGVVLDQRAAGAATVSPRTLLFAIAFATKPDAFISSMNSAR